MNIADRVGRVLLPGDEICWVSKSYGSPVLKRGIFLGIKEELCGDYLSVKMIATVWKHGVKEKAYKGYAYAGYIKKNADLVKLSFVEKI